MRITEKRTSLKTFLMGFGLIVTVCLLAGPKTAEAKYASLVMDAKTGLILHSSNMHTRNYPASLTKMMTLYMAFHALQTGRWTLNTRLSASRKATRQPPSKLAIDYRETITVDQAIRALVVKSANDIAVVVAEAHSGTERKFALNMTATARKLGMSRTTFRNASGLPHRGQLSTAHDMALLARRLMSDFPQYYGYFSETSFTYKGHTYYTHNKLMKSYKGADGLKTGYIRASGFNLVLSAVRNGQRLIGVVFGGNSSKHRNRHMAKLMNQGFRSMGVGADAEVRSAAKTPTPARKPKETVVASTRGTRSLPITKGEDWGVQVGAYGQYNPAYESAQKAVGIASKYLDQGMIKVVPLERRQKAPLYRARILGISKKEAYRACRMLERKRMPCMELRITDDMQLAFAGSDQ